MIKAAILLAVDVREIVLIVSAATLVYFSRTITLVKALALIVISTRIMLIEPASNVTRLAEAA